MTQFPCIAKLPLPTTPARVRLFSALHMSQKGPNTGGQRMHVCSVTPLWRWLLPNLGKGPLLFPFPHTLALLLCFVATTPYDTFISLCTIRWATNARTVYFMALSGRCHVVRYMVLPEMYLKMHAELIFHFTLLALNDDELEL